MDGMMKVAVMNGIGEMGYTERPIPQAKDDEVVVKLEYVGICGSDMHYYEMGRIGDYIVEPPFVLGHEPGGTVVETGKNVKHLKPGDRVALEPGKTCGKCRFRKEGKY
ncbi:GroES-like protein, partial [[Clostridium] hylemonae DSM 15053]